MSPRLTVVLPLRGRPLFTLRFLWHANLACSHYKFIVADGQVNTALARLIENSRAIFPNLDVEYVRYPDDTNFGVFYSKMFNAMQRVQTPYAMVADNDDFLMSTGIERSIEFLDSNSDYVCCAGAIGGFGVHNWDFPDLEGLRGRVSRLVWRYSPYDQSIDLRSPLAVERLMLGLRNTWSYFGVFRTPTLTEVWREAAEMNLSDLLLQEKFLAMRALTLGKAKSDPSAFGYFRQYGTSLSLAFRDDWIRHLVRSRFSTDFNDVISRISRLAAVADGIDESLVAEKLRNDLVQWLGNYLTRIYGPAATFRKHLRCRVPRLLEWVKKKRYLLVRFQRRGLVAKLREGGASDDYVVTFNEELSQVEGVVFGAAFAEFVRPYVPILVSGTPQKSGE